MPPIGSSVKAIGARDRFGVKAPGATISSLVRFDTSNLTILNLFTRNTMGMQRVERRMRRAMTTNPHPGNSVAATSACKTDQLRQHSIEKSGNKSLVSMQSLRYVWSPSKKQVCLVSAGIDKSNIDY